MMAANGPGGSLGRLAAFQRVVALLPRVTLWGSADSVFKVRFSRHDKKPMP